MQWRKFFLININFEKNWLFKVHPGATETGRGYKSIFIALLWEVYLEKGLPSLSPVKLSVSRGLLPADRCLLEAVNLQKVVLAAVSLLGLEGTSLPTIGGSTYLCFCSTCFFNRLLFYTPSLNRFVIHHFSPPIASRFGGLFFVR